MAAAFDYNRAPFFQSFALVQVLGTKNEVRVLPYGANGRLRWRDFQVYGHVRPEGQSEDEAVEFRISMRARRGQ
jgi:hypothetical protein